MTCIIGLVEKGHVYMGGDSMVTSGWDMERLKSRKVFQVGDYLIGCAGSARMTQLLQFELEMLPQDDKLSDYAYIVTVFTEKVRTLFRDKGYSEVKDQRESGGPFLVGYRGQLYSVQGDFSVLQLRDTFTALGCGSSYAMGAMSVLRDVPPKKRIRKALKAAAHFSIGVVGPFYVLSLSRKKEGA